MEVKAKLKFLRMSPRKTRLLADLVRGKNVAEAVNQLRFANKSAALPVLKLVKSAMANAVNNFSLDENNLYIKEIKIDGGPILKRWLPRAHGRATPINKHSSHINLTLAEIHDTGIKAGKKPEVGKAIKLGEKPTEKVKETKKKGPVDSQDVVSTQEIDKEIIDTSRQGRHGHVKKEGNTKQGFVNKLFNRKSG